MTTSPAKVIVCDEIFDENSLPSEQEVREYALKIGINPDTEKHFLNIALDGLMSPLPEEWKPCYDERIDRIYYYNTKSKESQWIHPLDSHFENVVKKRRQEESISAGDDDSKTSIKEDLKSFEEAVTTSEMLPSRNPLDAHRPRGLPNAAQGQGKVLNPIGRPPLPPKRRAQSASPSPRHSSQRIDIDNIAVLPSTDGQLKMDKTAPAKTTGIKLTGGGSAFLKSNQKPSLSQSPGPRSLEEYRFGLVRDAESLDLPEPKESKLKHSISLNESGFDMLTKSKRFASLQESLSSLKSDMEQLKGDGKSGTSTHTLRSILRDTPAAAPKLWDTDPVLLTGEEKEKLRLQEMRDERKQNVRFADIVTKPIDLQLSKSDSEDDSNTNDSSNDLDDLILEHIYSDDELMASLDAESVLKILNKKGDRHMTNVKGDPGSQTDVSSAAKKEANKNILSRLGELNVDINKPQVKGERIKRIMEMENNNLDDSDDWLTGRQQGVLNENEQRLERARKHGLDNLRTKFDRENNSLDKPKTLPTQLVQYMDAVGKGASPKSGNSPRLGSGKTDEEELDLTRVRVNEILGSKQEGFGKSKLMSGVSLQKVFDNLVKDQSLVEALGTVERMETSPQEEAEEPRSHEAEVRKSPRRRELDKHVASKLDEFKGQQRKVFDEKKALLRMEFEESAAEMRKELQRQESLERERFYAEVQQNMDQYKERLDDEKKAREELLRKQYDAYIKELEGKLSTEKEFKVMKLREEHDAYLKEQVKKINEEKTQFEEETKMKLQTSSSLLDKIVEELKEKEQKEIARLTLESEKRLDDIKSKIETEQEEQEKKFKLELEIVERDYVALLENKKQLLCEEGAAEVAVAREANAEALRRLNDDHTQTVRLLEEQCRHEEELIRKKHSERMDAMFSQMTKSCEKEDITQVNREYEKVRCEKRLLEDKYKSLKEKYVRLKNEVRMSMERKRQAKLNRQLQQRDAALPTTSTADDTTEDHGRPPAARRKLPATLSSDDQAVENPNGTPKTMRRRPRAQQSSSAESSNAPVPPPPPPPHPPSQTRPKNVRSPSPRRRREGASSAEDNHTSISEDIATENEDMGWVAVGQSALTPLENLRKQLEKLDDLEEQLPSSVLPDTYLRYPFNTTASASCELEFYRHRLHLEREAVRRAKQALSEQRLNIESRQSQLRRKQHTETLHQLHQEERDLTDMEVDLHRTRALLGEKIIRLRHLEQSIERAAVYKPTPATSLPPSAHSLALNNTDSSGFSGSEVDLSNLSSSISVSNVLSSCRGAAGVTVGTVRRTGVGVGVGVEDGWTESVLLSLESINSEIRDIWAILGKQQVPGLGPPPMVHCETRADFGAASPHHASDIADHTRRLKEWLVRTRDQQTRMIAPVTI